MFSPDDTLNPFTIWQKQQQHHSIANVLFLGVSLCDFFVNIWYPLYLTYQLLVPENCEVSATACLLHKPYTSWHIIVNDIYIHLFKLLSELYIVILAYVQYKQIRYPLNFLNIRRMKGFDFAVFWTFVLIVIVIGSTVLKLKVTFCNPVFHRFSQSVECQAYNHYKYILPLVECGIIWLALYYSFSLVYFLCKKRPDDMEETCQQRVKGAQVIFIMSITLVISAVSKEIMSISESLEIHHLTSMTFWFVCFNPCFVGAFNCVCMVSFNNDIRATIRKTLSKPNSNLEDRPTNSCIENRTIVSKL